MPLRFNKFDLRDYLWNLYNVEVTAVRSYVKQSPPTKNLRMRTYRPQSEKFMIAEMTRPFVWPAVPEDKSAWNHELWEKREKAQARDTEAMQATRTGEIKLTSRQPRSEERKEIAKMAEALLRGEAKWDNGVVLDEKWESAGKGNKPSQLA